MFITIGWWKVGNIANEKVGYQIMQSFVFHYQVTSDDLEQSAWVVWTILNNFVILEHLYNNNFNNFALQKKECCLIIIEKTSLNKAMGQNLKLCQFDYWLFGHDSYLY